MCLNNVYRILCLSFCILLTMIFLPLRVVDIHIIIELWINIDEYLPINKPISISYLEHRKFMLRASKDYTFGS